MDELISPSLTKYLQALLPMRDALLSELEREAALDATYAPIIGPEVAQLLRFLVRLVRPRRVLELGSAIGYSAIVMAREMEGGELITVERYDKAFERTLENVRRAGLTHIIRPLFEEAETVLSWIDGPFDLIFLDCAKGQYLSYLPALRGLLSEGGVLISDDVLYKGEVAGIRATEKRKATLVARLDAYLTALFSVPELQTTVLPIGDGVALSYKMNGRTRAV